MDRFIIPRRDDDLLRPVADAYYVERVVDDEGEIHDVLEGAFPVDVSSGESKEITSFIQPFVSPSSRESTARSLNGSTPSSPSFVSRPTFTGMSSAPS